MRRNPRRLIAVLVALTLLLPLAAAPASALTLQRYWTAKVGSSGYNGSVKLSAYTNGTSAMRYNLKHLRKSATYTVQIRRGTCSNLSTLLTTLAPIRTSSTGTVARTDVSLTAMSKIWATARKLPFVIRVVNGTSSRCGSFSFIKATKIVISSLRISLPVIQGTKSYPKCRVAMYYTSLSQPREPGVTYLFAHGRVGMFWNLLVRSKINNGASMIGMVVKVYTSDSYVSYYKIDKVRRHVTSMTGAYDLSRERLWLQTSEGSNYTFPKLVVEAHRYKTLKTTYSASHPTPHPVRC